MKNRLIIAAVAVLASLSLTACGGGDDPAEAPPTTPVTTTVAATTTTSTTPPPSTTTAEAAPITFECGDLSIYQSGTALYSDGTTGYEASCDTYVPPPAKVLQYCDYPGTAVYTDGSYSTTDPACAAMRA